MEKILVIAEIFPFPYNTGGKIRTANIIMQLSKYYEVHFICHSLERIDKKYINEAKKYCEKVNVIFEEKPSKIRKMINLFSKTCNAEYIVKSVQTEKIVKTCLEENVYKFVLVERLYAYQYIRKYMNYCNAVYVDMHDIEREAMSYFSKISKNKLQKVHYKIETKKVIRLENEVVKRCTKFINVSYRDSQIYSQIFDQYNKDKFIYLNNGIDINKAVSCPKTQREDRTIIFVGALGHPPNLHGIKWFVQTMWSKIFKNYPDAKLKIIGSGTISEHDKKLFDNIEGIEFLGYVEDLNSILRKATCLIVPLFSGSGTRLKILEAFAFEIPVISTTVGAEGLNCENGKELLIADSESEMYNDVVKIFDDKELVNYMVTNGFKMVQEEYNWENIIKRFLKVI